MKDQIKKHTILVSTKGTSEKSNVVEEKFFLLEALMWKTVSPPGNTVLQESAY